MMDRTVKISVAELDELMNQLAELKQQRDELQRDAERYRWLRDYQGYSYGMGSDTPAECGIAFEWVQSRPEESTMTIDAAIDAAIAKAKE